MNSANPYFQAGSNLEVDTGLLIHPRTSAFIDAYHGSLSRPVDLREQSCTAIRNPEKRKVDSLDCAAASGTSAHVLLDSAMRPPSSSYSWDGR
jgi:hypothetical protein